MSLSALSVSHRTAPLATLERLTMTRGEATGLLAELTRHPAVLEAVALSTCNRTELYLVTTRTGERAALDTLAGTSALRPAELRSCMRLMHGVAAARHLFRVAAGLESVVPGEPEIQGQVRRAHERARRAGATGPVTDRLFRSALDAGRRLRRETAAGPRLSVAAVAVRLAARRLQGLRGRPALVLGAGENAELVGRRLAERQARMVFVAGRRFGRARDLARRFGGRAVEVDALGAELAGVDAVFGCTSSPHPVLCLDQVAVVAARRPLLVIDMAVPRDVEPEVAGLPGIDLYDMDDLKREVACDAAEAPGVEPLLDEEVERFQAWRSHLDVLPAIAALRGSGDAAAEHVLSECEGEWESLSTQDRERVTMVARAVVSRMLHEPTMRLKRAGGTGDGVPYALAVRDLFGSEIS
jgi:glutamyl-tRNA reductase